MRPKITLIFIFAFLVSWAQEFQLSWQTPKSIALKGDTRANIPTFQKENFGLEANGMPVFHWSKPATQMQTLELVDLVWENVSSSQLGDIPVHAIPSRFEPTAKVMNANRSLTERVDFIPLVREGNQIKRLVRFTLSHSPYSYPNQPFTTPDTEGVLEIDNGDFYKIKVDTTGIFRLDYDFFVQNNIPTDFNYRNLKLYGNGGNMLPERVADFRYGDLQENAILAVGQEDGTFDQGDYMLFYAQGPHGIQRTNFSNLNNVAHTYNIYEDFAYYFINIGSVGQGKRVTQNGVSGVPAQTFQDFDQVLFYEKDSINLYNRGRQWFAREFSTENEVTYTFQGNGNINGNVVVDYRFVGVNAQTNSINVNLDGSNVGTSVISEAIPEFFVASGTGFVSGQYPLNVNINVDNATNPAGRVYLDFIRLKFNQNLSFSDQQMQFRRIQNLNDGQIYGFNISGNPEFVWDVSDRVNAKAMNQEGNAYLYQNNAPEFFNEFIAFNANQAYTPEFDQIVAPQNLRDLTNIDYLIITAPEFEVQARRLANYHQNQSGVTTAVVTTEQVYNEFSSGSQDISGIRDFIKFLYEKPRPLKYVLLFGDASYDLKDKNNFKSNFVPAYLSFVSHGLSVSYVTDDFFAAVDDTDTGIIFSPQMDVAIGRLPAESIADAELMVNKTLAYYNGGANQSSPFGDWRTRIHVVVDDDDPGENNAFHTTVDNESSQWIEQNFPAYLVRKLYVDAFQQQSSAGGTRYPQINQAIANAMETGSLFVNYFGHGGFNGWAQERIFTLDEVQNATNYNSEYSRMPVFMTVTCDFSIWDIPEIISGGEELLRNPEGGSVAILTTSREIGVSYGLNFNDKLVKRLFQIEGQKYLPLGEALRLAKIDFNSGTNGLKVNLLGDPLLSLARPPRQIQINTINGEPADSFSGTLRALDFVTIEGSVLNAPGNNVDTSFNGQLTGILYDKPVEITTLNNDGNIDELTFTEQNNMLFRGKTDVENGEFTLQFYVPLDINFEVGEGKLVFYAHNNQVDGLSAKNDILVGDINPEGVNDDEGPVVGLYMNNLNFANGGITNRDPYLLACAVDSTGINATGVGIGHDITYLLDGDVNSTTVLNEFYEGGDTPPCVNDEFQDYQKGRVLYRLRNLELGEHTVTFRIWDINNNSTTATLDFVVMEDGENQLYINRLLNWPNPFTTQTYFHFEHNCDSSLEVQVQIFTVSGKLVKTIRQTVSSAPFREGYRTDKFGIPWDGLDDFGNKIGKGVYIYRTIVKGSNPETCKGTATATEKLVILK